MKKINFLNLISKILRFESYPGVSRGLGDRVKAKTNVATVKLASALGFQVKRQGDPSANDDIFYPVLFWFQYLQYRSQTIENYTSRLNRRRLFFKPQNI